MSEPMTPDQARTIMAEHKTPPSGSHCISCGTGYPGDTEWPCVPYRLAAAYLKVCEDRDQARAELAELRRTGCYPAPSGASARSVQTMAWPYRVQP